MTYNEKKALLERYRDIDEYVKQLNSEKQEWYSMLQKIGFSEAGAVIGSKTKTGRTQIAAEKIIDFENRISDEVLLLTELRDIIQTQINKLSDIRLRRIIILKYIEGKNFESIAESCGYCTRQIVRLHSTAVNMLFEKCDEKRIVRILKLCSINPERCDAGVAHTGRVG